MSLVCNQQYHAFESCSFRGSCVVITLKLLQQVQSKIVKQMKQVKQVKSAFETSLMRLGIIEVDRRCLATLANRNAQTPTLAARAFSRRSRDSIYIPHHYLCIFPQRYPCCIALSAISSLLIIHCNISYSHTQWSPPGNASALKPRNRRVNKRHAALN